MHKYTIVASAAAIAILAAAPVAAQTAQSHAWEFEITPYAWMPGLKGTTAINNLPDVNVDMGPIDVLKDVKFFAAGVVEARNGRWGLMADLFYAKLGDSGGGNFSLHGGPGIDVKADVTLKQHLYTFAGAYRVLEGRTPVDLLVGARYNKIEIDTDIDLNFFGRLSISKSPSYEKNWWTPIAGVRVVHPIADQWSLLGYVDVGGGNGTKSMYQLIGGVNYDYSKTTAIKLGYRFYHVNYDHGGFKYDMNEKGITAGVGFKF